MKYSILAEHDNWRIIDPEDNPYHDEIGVIVRTPCESGSAGDDFSHNTFFTYITLPDISCPNCNEIMPAKSVEFFSRIAKLMSDRCWKEN